MRKLLASLMGGLFLFGCSTNIPAFAKEGCVTPDVAKAWLAERAPLMGYVTLTPVQAMSVLAWFNSEEPATDFNYVILARLQGGHVVLMVGYDGEVCANPALIPDEKMPALLQALTGTPA